MTQAPLVANTIVLVGLLSLPLTTLAGQAEPPKTAAQLDWVPASRLTPTEKANLSWYCSGVYREPPPATGIPDGFVRALANQSDYVAGEQTELYGNVQIAQQYRLIESPHVKLDSGQQHATIDGPLIIRDKGLTLTGEHAESNLEDGSGEVDQATFLLHLPRLRGEAKRIERLKSTDLVISNGSFTRCEPGSNVWSLHGKKIRLEPRTGFGTARDVTIRIKNFPLAYIPYMRFPIDDKRHTGFLMPSFGYEHIGGTDISVPVYFNLAPEYDLTWEPRSLWKRGLINTVQFRFLAGSSTNEINAAYIARDGVYDPRTVINPTTPFEKKDRWLLNLHHTGGWSSRWKSTVDYTAVSDIDYLRDIGGDIGSPAVNQYVNSVDQTLTSQRSAALNRLGEISYRGDQWNTSVSAQGFQSLSQTAAPQYQLLPQVNSAFNDQFGPFDTGLVMQYTSFDKNTNGITGPLAILGQRGVADAAVSWRKGTTWGYVQPRLDLVHRAYQLRDTPTGYDTHPVSTIPRMSLDAGLYFDRFFEFKNHALQQTLEPRIYYLYVPAKNQDQLPQFDASLLTPGFDQLFRNNRYNGWDRIGDADQVSLGLTTRVLDQQSGTQYLQMSLGQIYYFRDRQVIFNPGKVYNPAAPRSPLFWQARYSLPSGLDINASYEWEPSANRSNRADFSLHYVSGERRIFNISYIYTNPDIQPVAQFQPTKQTDLSLVWPVHGNWSMIGRWNFGWDLNQTIESIVGVEYNDCCWMSRLVFRHFLKEPKTVTISGVTSTQTPHDTGIFFEFQLKGLATLGRRLTLLLEEAIPGYSAREEKIGN